MSLGMVHAIALLESISYSVRQHIPILSNRHRVYHTLIIALKRTIKIKVNVVNASLGGQVLTATSLYAPHLV